MGRIHNIYTPSTPELSKRDLWLCGATFQQALRYPSAMPPVALT